MADNQKNDDGQAASDAVSDTTVAASDAVGIDPVVSDQVVEDQVEEVVDEPEVVAEEIEEEAVEDEVARVGEAEASTQRDEPAQAVPALKAQAEGGKTDGAGFTDQPLTCRECGSAFVWTAGEQAFYAQKGFDNPPVRCPNCRQLKKQQRMGGGGGGHSSGPREGVQITCSRCGKQDMVPFAPKGDKPVLCWDCYRATRSR